MAIRSNADTERLRGYRVKLYPTDEEKARLDQMISLSRYVYNWTIGEINRLYDAGEKFPSFFDLEKIFCKHRNLPENEWLKKLPWNASAQQIKFAYEAFRLFFKQHTGYPSFRSKRFGVQSMTYTGESVWFKNGKVKVSGFGRCKLIKVKKHHVPQIPKGKYYYNPTVTRDKDGNYWLSICAERPKKKMNKPQSDPIGIDVGVRTLITTSDGDFYNFPDTSKLEKKKKRLQRKASKDRERLLAESKRTKTKYHDLPKSKNMLKREAAVRKVYQRIKNIQDNYIHNVTTEIVERNPRAIVIEDINVREMVSNSNPISKNLGSDKPQMKFGMIHHCLTYKAFDRGIPLIIAPKDFPSTKKCSNCGNVYNIGSSKTYNCPHCGLKIDRDLNAAYNLRDLAY